MADKYGGAGFIPPNTGVGVAPPAASIITPSMAESISSGQTRLPWIVANLPPSTMTPWIREFVRVLTWDVDTATWSGVNPNGTVNVQYFKVPEGRCIILTNFKWFAARVPVDVDGNATATLEPYAFTPSTGLGTTIWDPYLTILIDGSPGIDMATIWNSFPGFDTASVPGLSILGLGVEGVMPQFTKVLKSGQLIAPLVSRAPTDPITATLNPGARFIVGYYVLMYGYSIAQSDLQKLRPGLV